MKWTTVKEALWRVLVWAGVISCGLFVVMALFTLIDGLVIGDSQIVQCGIAMVVVVVLAAGLVAYECDIL